MGVKKLKRLVLLVGVAVTFTAAAAVVESVTETFVAFMRPDGTVVHGRLVDLQPKTNATLRVLE